MAGESAFRGRLQRCVRLRVAWRRPHRASSRWKLPTLELQVTFPHAGPGQRFTQVEGPILAGPRATAKRALPTPVSDSSGPIPGVRASCSAPDPRRRAALARRSGSRPRRTRCRDGVGLGGSVRLRRRCGPPCGRRRSSRFGSRERASPFRRRGNCTASSRAQTRSASEPVRLPQRSLPRQEPQRPRP